MGALRSRLTLDGLQTIRQRVRQSIESGLLNTGYAIAADAANRAPKDTHYLEQSIHVVSETFSGHAISKQASTERFLEALAAGRTPKGRRIGPKSVKSYQFFPEIPPEPGKVFVVVGAVHGINAERGLRGRNSFLTAATYSNRGTLTKQIRKSLNGLCVIAEQKTLSKGSL